MSKYGPTEKSLACAVTTRSRFIDKASSMNPERVNEKKRKYMWMPESYVGHNSGGRSIYKIKSTDSVN